MTNKRQFATFSQKYLLLVELDASNQGEWRNFRALRTRIYIDPEH